jgi:tetratricopeptide (TPR) repeat protein
MRDEGPAAKQDAWSAFFHQQVSANARYWLVQIAAHSVEAPLLHRERDNIVKALDRALQLEAAWEPASHLILAFHPYMERRGVMADWERFVEVSLELSRQKGDPAAEGALLDRLGELKRDQGFREAAATCHEKAHLLCEGVGDAVGSARALANLGHVYRLERRYAEAAQVLEEALEGFRECQELDGQGFAHNTLGLVRFDEYKLKEALACYQEAYDVWSESGSLEGMARAQHNMGNTYRAQGNWLEAETCLRSAIALYEQTHSRLYLALASMDLGNVYLEQRQPERAETLYLRAEAVMKETGYIRGLAMVNNNLGMACTQQRRFNAAEGFLERSISLWRQLGEPVSQANTEDNLAEAYLKQQKWELAREVLDQALGRLSGFAVEGHVEELLSDIDEHLQAAEAGLGKALSA